MQNTVKFNFTNQPLNSAEVKKINPHLANYKPFFPENSEFSKLDVEVKKIMREFPELTAKDTIKILEGCGADSIRVALHMNALYDNAVLDHTNLYEHEGQVIDLTTLSKAQIITLGTKVDDIDKFESMAHVRSVLHSSTPNVKLYYPEPFIASPSFIHNDIAYIHILQYQFWL
jgi:hypothetical protein